MSAWGLRFCPGSILPHDHKKRMHTCIYATAIHVNAFVNSYYVIYLYIYIYIYMYICMYVFVYLLIIDLCRVNALKVTAPQGHAAKAKSRQGAGSHGRGESPGARAFATIFKTSKKETNLPHVQGLRKNCIQQSIPKHENPNGHAASRPVSGETSQGVQLGTTWSERQTS